MEQLWRKILGVPQDQEESANPAPRVVIVKRPNNYKIVLIQQKIPRKQQKPRKLILLKQTPDGKVIVQEDSNRGPWIRKTPDGKFQIVSSPQTQDSATATAVQTSETAKMSAKTEIRQEVSNMFKIATTRSSTKYLNNDGSEFKPFFLSEPAGAVASSPRTPQISGKPVK